MRASSVPKSEQSRNAKLRGLWGVCRRARAYSHSANSCDPRGSALLRRRGVGRWQWKRGALMLNWPCSCGRVAKRSRDRYREGEGRASHVSREFSWGAPPSRVCTWPWAVAPHEWASQHGIGLGIFQVGITSCKCQNLGSKNPQNHLFLTPLAKGKLKKTTVLLEQNSRRVFHWEESPYVLLE